MTESYRQKLLNWYCSVVVILAAAIFGLMLFWMIALQRWVQENTFIDVGIIAWGVAETSAIYLSLFPPVFVWHLLDFVQVGDSDSVRLRILFGYPMFLFFVTMTSVFLALGTSGVFTINSCDSSRAAFHHECFISTPAWISLPLIAACGCMVLLCIAKAVISIGSRMTKSS